MSCRELGVLIEFKPGGYGILRGAGDELFWVNINRLGGNLRCDPELRINDVLSFYVIEANNPDRLPFAWSAKVIARGIRLGMTYGEWLSWATENASENPKHAPVTV